MTSQISDRALRLLRALLILLLVATSVVAAPRASGADDVSTAAAPPAGAVWDFYTDFRRSPGQANPTGDAYANTGVWHYLGAPDRNHVPSGYTALGDFYTGACSGNLQIWRPTGSGSPYVGVHDGTATCDSVVPAKTGYLHPGSGTLSVIGWQSPFTGTVTVTGRVADGDHGSWSAGVTWSVDKGSTILASMDLPNTGAGNLKDAAGSASLRDIAVVAGEYLYLTIDPESDGHSGDGTVVEFTIIESSATSFNVNSTEDQVDNYPGDGVCWTGDTISINSQSVAECTLRAAVMESNALAGADTINVDAGTYTLAITGMDAYNVGNAAQGDLDITESVTITGAGAAETIVQASATAYSGIDRVFENWGSSTSSTIQDLTARNGNPGSGTYIDLGGGIRNNGPATLTLNRVTVTGNHAHCNGGGVFNWDSLNGSTSGGTLTISDSLITGNRAQGASGCHYGAGGGVTNDPNGVATITGSTISNNIAGYSGSGIGGGINNVQATLSIEDSTISGNSAGTAGGVRNYQSDLTVRTSSLENNSTSTTGINTNAGAIQNWEGTLTVSGSTFQGNSSNTAGAILNFPNGATATMSITGSTLSGNVATERGGGAIRHATGSTGSIVNSTISGNCAGTRNDDGSCTAGAVGTDGANGGGIFAAGTLTVTDTTISDNVAGAGGGINVANNLTTVTNSIVAGNRNASGSQDCYGSGGAVQTGGYNIGGDATCFVTGDTDRPSTDPKIGPLADNGGPTKTHALLSDSPAIDAGSTTATTDQRGATRPFDGKNSGTPVDDIGAYELNDDDRDGVDNMVDNCPAVANAAQADRNSDGAGDVCDDQDGDGLTDAAELTGSPATNPDDADTDDDTHTDAVDAFPTDATEHVDTDDDGTGNNADTDDDGDGQTDADETTCGSNPLSAGSKSTDTDTDNTPNCVDTDDDGDGVADGSDAFPTDPAETTDTDGDGTGNNADTDDDGDGVADASDACPLQGGQVGADGCPSSSDPAPAPAPAPTPSPTPSPMPTPAPGAPATTTTTTTVPAGGTATADSGRVSVTLPGGGEVTITEIVHHEDDEIEAPTGFDSIGYELTIEAPPTDGQPLQIEVSPQVGATVDTARLAVFLNGTRVAQCTVAGQLDPDPCYSTTAASTQSKAYRAQSAPTFSLLSTTGGTFSFAEADPACAAGGGSTFSDARSTVHADAIGCAADWGLARGTTADTFSPDRVVTRGQMASFLVGLMRHLQIEVPKATQTFADVPAGSIHSDAIASVAAAGIVRGKDGRSFGPGDPVTRQQAATMLVQLYEVARGTALPEGTDRFDDDTDSPHQSSINRAATAGLVLGVEPSRFDPAAGVRRDQMASLLARLLDRAIVDGHLTPR